MPARRWPPWATRAVVADNIDALVGTSQRKLPVPGDHILCMSNGGFGGIHAKLLAGATK